MPKQELTPKEKVSEALEQLHKAMNENIDASMEETRCKIRKQQAYHKVVEAKQYLTAVEKELMEISYEKEV